MPLTHWLPELFAENAFSGHFDGFRLDFDQISFNLDENAFATQQLASLPPSIAFYDSLTRACAEILRPLSVFLIFFRLSFFSFSILFAAVIDLLLGLLGIKKLLRKCHRDGQFLRWSSQVRCGHHCKDFFLLHKLSIDDANFGQKGWRQKWKKGRVSSLLVTAGTGVNELVAGWLFILGWMTGRQGTGWLVGWLPCWWATWLVGDCLFALPGADPGQGCRGGPHPFLR